MRRLTAAICALATMITVAYGRTETYSSGKEMKQVTQVPPCPEWYRDTEFNVSLWGTYIFTFNNWDEDRYFESDHAWGGGIDAKYFFHRYFGVGVEGWMVDSRQAREKDFVDVSDGIFQQTFDHVHKGIGAVLGTVTLRYPIPCTRFSPYLFGGGGAIFGGGQRRIDERFTEPGEGFDIVATTGHTDSETKAIGQVGGGMEIRLTPHIGWVSDFSWNFVDGPNNNFGMIRSGVNFAF